jgi:DNA-binding transcriptional MocR family regulator
MRKHAAILKPKFDAVLDVFEKELDQSIAEWSQPNGGYFININTLDGCAKAVVSMVAEAGVKLTSAGSTFPYRKDPRDRNIRIAPSLPSIEEIRLAMELVSVCIKLASIDRLK